MIAQDAETENLGIRSITTDNGAVSNIRIEEGYFAIQIREIDGGCGLRIVSQVHKGMPVVDRHSALRDAKIRRRASVKVHITA